MNKYIPRHNRFWFSIPSLDKPYYLALRELGGLTGLNDKGMIEAMLRYVWLKHQVQTSQTFEPGLVTWEDCVESIRTTPPSEIEVPGITEHLKPKPQLVTKPANQLRPKSHHKIPPRPVRLSDQEQ